MSLINLPLPVIVAWLIFSIVGLIVISVYFSQRREQVVLQYMTFFMAALLWWQIAYVFEVVSVTLESKIFWCDIQFFGLFTMPFLWMVAILSYCNRSEGIKWTLISWIIFVVLTIFVILTNDALHLFHGNPSMVVENGIAIVDFDYGLWYYMVFLPITFGLFLGSIYVLIQHSKNVIVPLYKQQINTLIGIVLLNLVASTFYNLGYYLVGGVENISFTLPLTSLLAFIALRKLKLFELMPLANQLIIQNLNDGIIVVNDQCRLIFFNPIMKQIVPEISSSHIGESFQTVFKDVDYSFANCLDHLRENKIVEFSMQSDDEVKYFELRQSPIIHESEYLGTIFQFRDVTNMVQLNRRLQFVAHHDALTGLLNRYSFFEQAESQFEQAKDRQTMLGIVMLDFDNFKHINDQYGHLMGDRVLVEVAKECQLAIRNIDIVACYGGDEFIFLISGFGDQKDYATIQIEFKQVIDRLSKSLSGITINNVVYPEVTLGAALFDPDNPVENLSILIDQADQRLYAKKNVV